MKQYMMIGVIIMISCNKPLIPPVAKKIPIEMKKHGSTRVDDYYWMRLTDEQKTADPYDNQTKEVVDYINMENDYTKNSLQHTNNLQE